MQKIIFYSWQSDLPNRTNRGFIQVALESAAKTIANDGSIAVEPVVDRDTQGIAGSPDIASTIFAKITAADIVVADISIIGKTNEGRSTPNPNVLIELGYALKALGYERVILVFNKAFGEIEDLPFDLRMRRLVAYDMPQDQKDRATERKQLQDQLDAALRSALTRLPAADSSPTNPSLSAIETKQSNRIIVLRRDLKEILETLVSLEPPIFSAGGTVEDLLSALDKTQETVAAFSKITEMITVMDDLEAAVEVHRWFGAIFERYNLPEGFSGTFTYADQDYFKFVGHELFVTTFAYLLREGRWSILDRLLDEPISLRYLSRTSGPANVYWDFASEHLASLLDEGKKRKRLSLHADILNARHTTGGLAAVLPLNEFIAADFLLFLRSELPPEETPKEGVWDWRPWSCLYMKHAPQFLLDAEQTRIASQLTKILSVPSVDELKKRLAARYHKLSNLFRGGFWELEFRDDVIKRIGTR